jgi:hypothetical protein
MPIFDSRCRNAHLYFLRCDMSDSSEHWDRVGVENRIKVQVCHLMITWELTQFFKVVH